MDMDHSKRSAHRVVFAPILLAPALYVVIVCLNRSPRREGQRLSL